MESRKNKYKKTQRRCSFKKLEAGVCVDRLGLKFNLESKLGWEEVRSLKCMVKQTMYSCMWKESSYVTYFLCSRKNMAATTSLPLSGNRKNKYATNKSAFYLPHYNSATCYDRVHAAAGEFLHSL